MKTFDRIAGGSKTRRKKAGIALARKIGVIAWAMMRDETTWDASKTLTEKEAKDNEELKVKRKPPKPPGPGSQRRVHPRRSSSQEPDHLAKTPNTNRQPPHCYRSTEMTLTQARRFASHGFSGSDRECLPEAATSVANLEIMNATLFETSFTTHRSPPNQRPDRSVLLTAETHDEASEPENHPTRAPLWP